MRKILILFTIILLATCITGCSPNTAATEATQQAIEATATLKVGQTPAAASQQETPPTASKSQSAAMPSPVTQPTELPISAIKDLSYADANKYPGLNGPLMVEDNSYFYYCSDGGISKLDKQTGQAQVISQYEPSYIGLGNDFFSIYQNRIYFMQDNTIRSIDINGNDLKVLLDWDQYIAHKNSLKLKSVEGSSPFNFLTMNNGLLYFESYDDNKDESNILELNPATDSLSIFIDNAENAAFYGNYVYYVAVDNVSYVNEVYRMNITTGKKELVVGKDSSINNADVGFGDFTIANNQLYFTATVPNPPYQNCLYKCDSSGSIEKLYNLDANNSIAALMGYANNLYFIDSIYSNGNSYDDRDYQKSIIYKLEPQTGKCTPISLMGNYNGGSGVGIINNTIFYRYFDNEGSVIRYIDLKN